MQEALTQWEDSRANVIARLDRYRKRCHHPARSPEFDAFSGHLHACRLESYIHTQGQCMSITVDLRPVEVVRNEVARFVHAARQRSESDSVQRRRSQRRYHRSWPLVVWFDGSDSGAALHNASDQGIAFLSCCPMTPDSVVFVKLFGYEEGCPCVPAVVRHSTQTEHGFLIGCEFELADESLCQEAILQTPQTQVC
jgi:hypothetical protein